MYIYLLFYRQNRPAELMAKFLDVKLKGEKGLSDDDVESVLDKVMVLFRCTALRSCAFWYLVICHPVQQQHRAIFSTSFLCDKD